MWGTAARDRHCPKLLLILCGPNLPHDVGRASAILSAGVHHSAAVRQMFRYGGQAHGLESDSGQLTRAVEVFVLT